MFSDSENKSPSSTKPRDYTLRLQKEIKLDLGTNKPTFLKPLQGGHIAVSLENAKGQLESIQIMDIDTGDILTQIPGIYQNKEEKFIGRCSLLKNLTELPNGKIICAYNEGLYSSYILSGKNKVILYYRMSSKIEDIVADYHYEMQDFSILSQNRFAILNRHSIDIFEFETDFKKSFVLNKLNLISQISAKHYEFNNMAAISDDEFVVLRSNEDLLFYKYDEKSKEFQKIKEIKNNELDKSHFLSPRLFILSNKEQLLVYHLVNDPKARFNTVIDIYDLTKKEFIQRQLINKDINLNMAAPFPDEQALLCYNSSRPSEYHFCKIGSEELTSHFQMPEASKNRDCSWNVNSRGQVICLLPSPDKTSYSLQIYLPEYIFQLIEDKVKNDTRESIDTVLASTRQSDDQAVAFPEGLIDIISSQVGSDINSSKFFSKKENKLDKSVDPKLNNAGQKHKKQL